MSKQPWLVPGVPWKTESAFWSWLRGVLRNGWKKHPVKLEYIKQHRKQIVNPNPKGKKDTVWGMTCSCCGQDTVQSQIEIDHISETGGKFTSLEDVRGYVEYLFFIDFDSIRPVCKTCHQCITLSQRKGISFEEALLQKRIIATMKLPKEKLLDWLQQKEYNVQTLTNNSLRRKAVEDILRKEMNDAN